MTERDAAPAVDEAMTTPRKPTSKPASKPAGRTAAPKAAGRTAAIATAGAVGALAAGLFGALKFGWLDRALVKARGNAEHPVPDLAPDAPTPGTHRAEESFRPDPTAPVTAAEREALRPPRGRPVTAAETD